MINGLEAVPPPSSGWAPLRAKCPRPGCSGVRSLSCLPQSGLLRDLRVFPGPVAAACGAARGIGNFAVTVNFGAVAFVGALTPGGPCPSPS